MNLSSCANFCLIGPTLLPVVVVLHPLPEVIRVNVRFAPDPFCCCFLYPLVNTSSRMLPFQVHRRVNLQHKQLLIFTKRKNWNVFSLVFDFNSAASSSGSRSLSSATSTLKPTPKFFRSAGLNWKGDKRHSLSRKLFLATGTAAVSNAFSCAGLGRL